jgi:hypothetical protein
LEYKDSIIKTFRSVGMSLNPNGSEDSEIKIKGLEGIQVGERRRVGTTQEDSNEATLDAVLEVVIVA